MFRFGAFGETAGAGGPGRALSRVTRGGAGAAAAVLGVRVGRPTVLRVSALLALRSLLAPLQLPLDAGVAAAVWSVAFSASQTAVLLAVAADRLRWGGLLGRWGASIFTPADAPFVALYAAVVLCCGPVVALLEAIVVTFEVMRLTRKLEDHMHDAAPTDQQTTFWQVVIVSLSLMAFSLSAALVLKLPVSEISMHTMGIATLTLLVTLVTPDGNILHAALLTLYATVVLTLGLSEHLDVTRSGLRPLLHSPESRATQLVLSTVLTLYALVRAPHFMRTVLYGAEVVESDNAMQSPLKGPAHGAVSALAVISVTFRFLVYNADVLPGEYYPLFCRGLQIATAVTVYCMFLWMEARSNPPPQPSRAEDPAVESMTYEHWQEDKATTVVTPHYHPN